MGMKIVDVQTFTGLTGLDFQGRLFMVNALGKCMRSREIYADERSFSKGSQG